MLWQPPLAYACHMARLVWVGLLWQTMDNQIGHLKKARVGT